MAFDFMLKYIELKSEYNDDGPAWIGHVTLSKSGRTVYFNGKAFKRAVHGALGGNYFDLDTRDIYWISGIKKRGLNRHWAGSGKITIEAAAVDEYLRLTQATELDRARFLVSETIQPTDPARFHESENRSNQVSA
jgi:hypothetical protein